VITVTDMATWGFVGLSGELDASDSDELLSAVDELMGIGAIDVTVDLSRVTSIGAAAVDALVAAGRLLETAGGQMGLVGMTESFCRRCRTSADRDWRWCPDCGGRLGAVPRPGLRHRIDRPAEPAATAAIDTLLGILRNVGRDPEAR
jgi:anti-anti-sigma factor